MPISRQEYCQTENRMFSFDNSVQCFIGQIFQAFSDSGVYFIPFVSDLLPAWGIRLLAALNSCSVDPFFGIKMSRPFEYRPVHRQCWTRFALAHKRCPASHLTLFIGSAMHWFGSSSLISAITLLNNTSCRSYCAKSCFLVDMIILI